MRGNKSTANAHNDGVVIPGLDRFLPYGPQYNDRVVDFMISRDDGYSPAVFFQQPFLLGCQHHRRFHVRFLTLTKLIFP